jgi:hypothetical protein
MSHPKALVKLASCIKEEHEIDCPFEAELDGQQPVWITAVLDRTAVYHSHGSSERFLARHERITVLKERIKHRKISAQVLAQAKGRKRGRAIQLGHSFPE